MKKKLLSIVLAICLLISCAFALTACGEDPSSEEGQQLTNSEISAIYKEVAIKTWAKIDVDDPTVETTSLSLMSASNIPDKKQETTNAYDLLLIKMNSNNMSSVIYLIGLLYDNSDFLLKDGVAKFDGTVSTEIMGMSFDYNYTFTIKPQLDIENNKVYLEAYIVANEINEQYIVIDVNYNFESKAVISFRIYTVSGDMFLDLGITEENKYEIYATTDTDDSFAVYINTEFDSFKNSVRNISKLSAVFSEEIQSYFTLLSKVQTDIMG